MRLGLKGINVLVLFFLLAMPAAGQENPFASKHKSPSNPFAEQHKQRFVGVFKSDVVTLTLGLEGQGYQGKLYYAVTGETYDVDAKANDNTLTGAFKIADASFEFSLVLDDEGNGEFSTQGY